MRPLVKPRFTRGRGTREGCVDLTPETLTSDLVEPGNLIYTEEKYLNLLAEVHSRITEDAGFNGVHLNELLVQEKYEECDAYLTRFAKQNLRTLMEEPTNPFPPINAEEEKSLMAALNYEILGYGPLEELLRHKAVSDILVNTYAHIYTDRSGILRHEKARFKDNVHLMRIIRKIVEDVNRDIDMNSPMVDARLERHSHLPERTVRARINAIIEPVAIDGPILSLRKFPEEHVRLDTLIANKTLTPEIGELLKGICRAKLNVLIAGGTSSGKTTLLNVISDFIAPEERIVTIEDTAELHLLHQHVVRLETRPPAANMSGAGQGEITQRDLVKNSLRMRPDRIILGEVRGSEAFDMLQALNTGHKGSLTTIHANSSRDALARLESMVAIGSGNLPSLTIRQAISRAFDVILYMERIGNSRKLTSLQEITDIDDGTILLQEIFSFQQTGMDGDSVKGTFQASGIRPDFLRLFEAYNIALPPHSMFSPDHVIEV